MITNSLDWRPLFVSSMVVMTTSSANTIFHWVACFAYVLLNNYLITVYGFFLFPITSKNTRLLWPVSRGCSLLHDTWTYLKVYERSLLALFLFLIIPFDFLFWSLFVIITCDLYLDVFFISPITMFPHFT